MTHTSFTLWALLSCASFIPAHAVALSHQPPVIIYVDRFSTQDILDKANDLSLLGADSDEGNRPLLFGVRGRHQEQQEYGLVQKLPTLLQKTLVQSLNQHVARATAGDGMLATQLNCWVMRGQFVVVNRESRSAQSHVEMHVQIYTLSDPDVPFLIFDAKGASGHMPDQAATKNSCISSVKLAMANKDPEKETQRIGRQIAEELGKFMTAQDIPTLAVMKAAGMTPPAALDSPPVSPVYSSKGG